MLVSQHNPLSKSNSGKSQNKLDTISEEKNSLKRSGNGKMSMVVKLTTSLEDSVSLSTGRDLLSLLMILDQRLSLKLLLECSTKDSSIELQDSSTGVAL